MEPSIEDMVVITAQQLILNDDSIGIACGNKRCFRWWVFRFAFVNDVNGEQKPRFFFSGFHPRDHSYNHFIMDYSSHDLFEALTYIRSYGRIFQIGDVSLDE